ncbi:MAG TPA: hypothetical protein VJN94_15060 [Candidatus Binataceae bacterium]|nr:hypothetical protein [Candidatus Binataceae bacterium]
MKSGQESIRETLYDDPAQRFEYYALRTPSVLEGERALMFAVLVDALDTFAKTRYAKGHRGKAAFNEVNGWIRSDSTSSPFSFESICESLGLNPDAIRCSLKSPNFNERQAIRHFRHVASNGGLETRAA